jgi:hypothetical protein
VPTVSVRYIVRDIDASIVFYGKWSVLARFDP